MVGSVTLVIQRSTAKVEQLVTAFALFFFQHPSLLAFQERRKKKTGRSHPETIFGVREVPSQTQLRAKIDRVEPEAVRQLLPLCFEKIRGAGWAAQFQSEVRSRRDTGKYYVTALDGTGYFDEGGDWMSELLATHRQNGRSASLAPGRGGDDRRCGESSDPSSGCRDGCATSWAGAARL